MSTLYVNPPRQSRKSSKPTSDETSHFPSELIPKLAAMGLLGIIFPVEYGGAGLGYVEYVVALEELARVDGSVALTVSAHTSLCTNHIYR